MARRKKVGRMAPLCTLFLSKERNHSSFGRAELSRLKRCHPKLLVHVGMDDCPLCLFLDSL